MEIEDFVVKPGDKLDLSKFRTNAKGTPPKAINKLFLENKVEMAKYQNKLYAENKQSLLIILQGMDASGKDSIIRHIMDGVNPQGVQVTSFKHPSALELSHDYLWRHYVKLPEQGQIGIFNRSHYENVLISRVHPELVLAERIPKINEIDDVNEDFWQKRYKQIRGFERTIHQTGTQVLKFFLHLSREEQKQRFLDRINKKDKHWKFSASDITERKFWDDYQNAYEMAIQNTSTKKNPWYIIPADDKWFAQMLISQIIIKKLDKMDIKYPVQDEEQMRRLAEAEKLLMQEGQ
jgi:PPK2 family polyphosphate:nucleotide phosphotransferase